jgi:cobalamin-dependent methionine synthase I
LKKACEKVDSKGATVASNHGEEQDEEVEVDVNLLPEKEKNKIILQREKEAQKAKDKADKEAMKAKDKRSRPAKKGGRASKSKTVATPSPPILMTETSTASPLQNPRKWDSSFAQLSVSRLQ